MILVSSHVAPSTTTVNCARSSSAMPASPSLVAKRSSSSSSLSSSSAIPSTPAALLSSFAPNNNTNNVVQWKTTASAAIASMTKTNTSAVAAATTTTTILRKPSTSDLHLSLRNSTAQLQTPAVPPPPLSPPFMYRQAASGTVSPAFLQHQLQQLQPLQNHHFQNQQQHQMPNQSQFQRPDSSLSPTSDLDNRNVYVNSSNINTRTANTYIAYQGDMPLPPMWNASNLMTSPAANGMHFSFPRELSPVATEKFKYPQVHLPWTDAQEPPFISSSTTSSPSSSSPSSSTSSSSATSSMLNGGGFPLYVPPFVPEYPGYPPTGVHRLNHNFHSHGFPVSSHPMAGPYNNLGNPRPVRNQSGKRPRGSVCLYYKTELCDSFPKPEGCPLGNRCKYAHGPAELRPRDVPANYKTERCRPFWTTGQCEYGERCLFIHDEPSRLERLLPPSPTAPAMPLPKKKSTGDLRYPSFMAPDPAAWPVSHKAGRLAAASRVNTGSVRSLWKAQTAFDIEDAQRFFAFRGQNCVMPIYFTSSATTSCSTIFPLVSTSKTDFDVWKNVSSLASPSSVTSTKPIPFPEPTPVQADNSHVGISDSSNVAKLSKFGPIGFNRRDKSTTAAKTPSNGLSFETRLFGLSLDFDLECHEVVDSVCADGCKQTASASSEPSSEPSSDQSSQMSSVRSDTFDVTIQNIAKELSKLTAPNDGVWARSLRDDRTAKGSSMRSSATQHPSSPTPSKTGPLIRSNC